MKVGFFTVYHGDPMPEATMHLILADLLIESVRRTMPGVEIHQLTDLNSPALLGVDGVHRLKSRPMAELCVEHYASVQGDWLFVDTDVVIQQDVREVFKLPFDVAVCDRDGTLVPGEEELDFIKATPYNLGVVFSRNPEFWKAVLARMETMPKARKEWMGNQYAACDVIAEGRFHVQILPGLFYNYAAHNTKDRGEEAMIQHYKGPFRKQMALERFRRELCTSVS